MQTTFFEEQERYRRSTWRWTAVAGTAAALMGLPLSLIFTPVVYLVALVALHLANQILTVPQVLWSWLDRVGTVASYTLAAFEYGPWAAIKAVLPYAIFLVAPGVAVIVLTWIAVRRLLEAAGVHTTMEALAARSPDPDSAEEQQLVNVVEEMAVAAGMQPPPVYVVDQLSPNLALLGDPASGAAIVVSRLLLETCDRAETQALVGHALASLAHGDPAIALRLESVHLTGAGLHALVNAPFGRQGRRVVWSLLRAARRRASLAEAARALAILLEEWGGPSNDLTRFLERDTARPPNILRQLAHLPLLPLYLVNMAVLVTAGLLEAGLIGPVLGALWRTRRMLADAGAVQLTRNPTELARALHNISGARPDVRWTPARLQTVVTSDAPDPLKNPGGLTASHPRLDKRLKRLEAQGAMLAWPPLTTAPRRLPLLEKAGVVLLAPLLVLLAYLMGMVVVLVTLLAVAAMAVTLAIIHALFTLLQ